MHKKLDVLKLILMIILIKVNTCVHIYFNYMYDTCALIDIKNMKNQFQKICCKKEQCYLQPYVLEERPFLDVKDHRIDRQPAEAADEPFLSLGPLDLLCPSRFSRICHPFLLSLDYLFLVTIIEDHPVTL